MFGKNGKMVGLPGGEKSIENMFTHFGTMHERDGETDGHHMTYRYAALCIARQRRHECVSSVFSHWQLASIDDVCDQTE